MALMRTKRGVEPGDGKKVNIKQAKTSSISYAQIENPEQRNLAAAKAENPIYEKKIKSGEYVPLSSLDPTSKSLWSRAIGNVSRDVYGDIEDVAIPKSKSKVSKFSDIYGVDYNPDEYSNASRSGNLDKYLSDHPEIQRSGAPIAEYGGHKYKVAEKKKEVINPADAKLTKLPLLPADKLSYKTKGGLKYSPTEPITIEKDSWFEPTVTKRAKKIERAGGEGSGRKQVFGHGRVKELGKPAERLKYMLGNTGVARTVEYAKEKAKLKRELPMAKAYYGDFAEQGMSDIEQRKSLLKVGKSEMNKAIRSTKDAELKSAYKVNKQEYKTEIKNAKMAGKYLKKLYSDSSYIGIPSSDMGPSGKISYATPKAMQGFAESEQPTTGKRMIFGRNKSK